MMRALYSGVAGLKTHMTRLDVIGNNIANVNTYGFKSSRATFRDVYSQQIRGASAGTNTRGGINPSAIGYGTQLASVDLQMGQSAMTNTGNTLDLAITGDGFFQVQDPDGNIYYTKAGMLNIDTNGCVVDGNGNFVLGTTATSGKLDSQEPGSSIIKINVDPVEPAVGTLETDLLGRKLRISSDTQKAASNVTFTISSSNIRANGQPFYNGEKLEVIMESGSSNITVRLNQDETFKTMDELSDAINEQIRAANGGAYEGGTFTFKLYESDGITETNFGTRGLTGAELTTSRDNGALGTITKLTGLSNTSDTEKGWPGVNFVDTFGSAFGSTFGDEIKNADLTSMTYKVTEANGTTPAQIEFTVTVAPKNADGTAGTAVTYTGKLTDKVGDTGTVLKLYEQNSGGTGDDYMGLKISKAAYDNFTAVDATKRPPETLSSTGTAGGGSANSATISGLVSRSTESTSIGLGKQSWTLSGGTEGGPQSYENLTGIAFNPDGTIVGSHAVHGRLVLGRIDLANFVNPQGLSQAGNSYYTPTENSGRANLAIPGEDGTGAVKSSALEMSNVDLSQEFSDMIVTQRGYQANARIITVSDTMLEELVNLKR